MQKISASMDCKILCTLDDGNLMRRKWITNGKIHRAKENARREEWRNRVWEQLMQNT